MTKVKKNLICPCCRLPQSQWDKDLDQGYRVYSRTYCCKSCARGGGCTCLNFDFEEYDAAEAELGSKLFARFRI